MKYKIERKKNNPDNDMRLVSVETGNVLGYILKQNYYRTTVWGTGNGLVYRRDNPTIHSSILYILKKHQLDTEEIKELLQDKT